MRNRFRALSLLLLALVALLGAVLTGCEPKEDIVTTDPAAVLTASVEQVKFDTVFTNLGSITKRFWVYNRHARAVKVDEISLVGGASAVARFELLIDGRPGPTRRDFELRGKDSVLVLAKVTIDPNAADTAFLVLDSVRLRANGTTGYVRLRAYGENARYYDAPAGQAVLVCDETWTAQRPIVLLGSVLVQPDCQLTIAPGTRVYCARNASLVVRGKLTCGDLGGAAVKFRGLRRDDFFDTTDPRYAEMDDWPKYANTPGQWGYIGFFASPGRYSGAESTLLNTDIRNASYGVLIYDTLYLPQRIRLDRCVIRNAYTAGLLGIGAGSGGGVSLTNTVITRCGQQAILSGGGGNWHLAHCTIEMGNALFPRRDTEALLFSDAAELRSGVIAAATVLTVENSIVWSGLRNDKDELRNEIRLVREVAPDSLYTFRHNVLQTPFARFNDAAHAGVGNPAGTNILNEDPDFRAPREPVKFDLRLDSLQSPARRLGVPLLPPVPVDVRRQPRNPAQPSAGAYEQQ